MNVCDIELSEEEMGRIDALERGHRIFNPITWDGIRNMPYFQ